MTDINKMNSLNNIQNIQHVKHVKDGNVQKVDSAERKSIDNLVGPADVVGRSQVQKPDNLKEDINFILKNPEIMEKAEAFFEMAYEKLLKEDSPNAYEKAAAMATTFARELASN